MMMHLLPRHHPARWVVAVLRMGSSVLFIISAYALIGVWVGKVNATSTSKWAPDGPGMTVNTALSFLVVSILFAVVARYINDQPNTTRTHRGSRGSNRVLRPAGLRQGRSN